VSVTFPGDGPGGTWVTDNNGSIVVNWVLSAGTNLQQAAGSWGAGAMASPNQSNFTVSTSNVFELFDVGLYEGNVAPPFMVPDYATELAGCQRYLRRIRFGTGIAYSTTQVRLFIPHVGLRAVPTATIAAPLQITDAYSANFTQSAISIVTNTISPDSGQYDCGNFAGLTLGRFYAILNTSPDVIMNARL
jgi:hypothetical protein